MFIYFSFHGSSLIGLPLPPSFVVYCFCSCDHGRIKAGDNGAAAPGPPKNRPIIIPSQ